MDTPAVVEVSNRHQQLQWAYWDSHEQFLGRDAFAGTSMASRWRPVPMWREGGDEGLAMADIMEGPQGALTMSDRAREVLAEFLDPAGEFLPVEADPPIHLWNCTRVVEALDPEATEGLQSGGRWIYLDRLVLRRAAVADEGFFCIPQGPGRLFATRWVVEAVDGAGLTGWAGKPVEVS